MAGFFVTEKDDALLGAVRRADPMGFLAVWSNRARDLVPHLTEQTTSLRGFQMLVTAFALWERYAATKSPREDELPGFFLIVEQTFARLVVRRQTGAWDGLPGGRRVRALQQEPPYVALQVARWALLDNQRANGLWGLYRGAAQRAGLLTPDMDALSDKTRAAVGPEPLRGEKTLFDICQRALNGETVALPERNSTPLAAALWGVFDTVPQRKHLKQQLIDVPPLNRWLAGRLRSIDALDRRKFVAAAVHEAPPAHVAALTHVGRCERLLAPVEAVFEFLSSQRGATLEAAAGALPAALDALAEAKAEFADSGHYDRPTAAERHRALLTGLDTGTKVGLARSVLELHAQVSQARGRAMWTWLEADQICSDVDLAAPEPKAFRPELAWRNDYYLEPLRQIERQFADLSGGQR